MKQDNAALTPIFPPPRGLYACLNVMRCIETKGGMLRISSGMAFRSDEMEVGLGLVVVAFGMFMLGDDFLGVEAF